MSNLLPPSHQLDLVYVPVPVEKLEAVYRLLGARDKQIGETGGEVDRRRLLERVYVESDQQFRALLQFLAARPGKPHSTVLIAESLGLPSGAASLAGMLGAFARRAKNRYDGFWPFERLYNPAQEKSELMMDPEIARIVSQLIEATR